MIFRITGAVTTSAALACAGCASAGGGGSCMDDTLIAVSVAGLDGYACDVTLDSPGGAEAGARKVVIHFPATCSSGDGGLADAGPDGACGLGAGAAEDGCTAVSGPSPNLCSRNGYLTVDFSGGALRSFVGPSFTVTATCGGTILVQRSQMIGCSQAL